MFSQSKDERKKVEQALESMCYPCNKVSSEFCLFSVANIYEHVHDARKRVPFYLNTAIVIVDPQCLWCCHCESSPGSSDECSTCAGWALIFGPSRSS